MSDGPANLVLSFWKSSLGGLHKPWLGNGRRWPGKPSDPKIMQDTDRLRWFEILCIVLQAYLYLAYAQSSQKKLCIHICIHIYRAL